MKKVFIKLLAILMVCSIILASLVSASAYNIGNYTILGHNAATSARFSLWTNQHNEHELHGEMYGTMDKPISMCLGMKGAIYMSDGSYYHYDDWYNEVTSPDGSMISDSHWRSPNFSVKHLLKAKYKCIATDYLDCQSEKSGIEPWNFG